MGKVVPFERKPGSPEEEALRQRLQANPNDLENLTKLFLLKVQEEKFDPKSDYAKGILRCIETAGLEAINRFLHGVAHIVEAMDWSEPSPEFTTAIAALVKKANEMVKEIPTEIRAEILFPTRFKNEIYKSFFEEDKFLDYVCRIVPTNANHEPSSRKSDKRDLLLKSFLVDCFKKIIAKYGLVELLVNIIVFSSCPILDAYSEVDIQKLILPYRHRFSEKDKIYRILNKIAENYLTALLASLCQREEYTCFEESTRGFRVGGELFS